MIKNSDDLQYKRWLRSHYKKAWPTIVILLVFSLIAIGFTLASPWPMKFLADSVFGTIPPPALFQNYTQPQLLLVVMAAVVVIGLFEALFNFITDYFSTILAENFERRVEQTFLKHVLSLPLRSSTRLENSDYVYRLNSQGSAIGSLVVGSPVEIISSIVSIVFVLIILISVNVQMTLISLVVVPFLYFSIIYFGKRIEAQSQAVETLNSTIYNHTLESIEQSDVVQSFNSQERQLNKFTRLLLQMKKLNLKGVVLSNAFGFSGNLVVVGSTLTVFIVGGQKVFNGQLSFGILLVFISYVTQLYEPLQQLTSAIAQRRDDHARAKKFFEVINDHSDIENTNTGEVLDKARGQLNFRNVTFRYGDKTVLDGVNLDIKPGEKVGFIGPSGAGKSTLVSLVPRFGIQEKGFVYLDGKDTSTINLKSLREQIAIVSQEPKLFSISIGENIGFARPDEQYPLPEVMGAASAANASEFIDKLPEKYDTMVDNSGDSLSGGQKQRIAVARAMFKRAPILILDEPTSAQDAASENKVLEGINSLMKGKTVLMVTHKHSLLSAMDTIYVVEAGKVKNVKEYGGLDAYERYLKIHER